MANRSPRSAREIDIHLGHRLRAARQAQHISQTELAVALGITFQQIQKYEEGSNRISAARLFEIAHVLGAPITLFFEGAKQPQLARGKRRGR
jgi:transcriptional regulator with XRE-family HTH domain